MSDLLVHLPKEHPDRNKPLAGARYRCWQTSGGIGEPQVKKWGAWREVLPTWHIAKKTYNQLGFDWLVDHQWKFEK